MKIQEELLSDKERAMLKSDGAVDAATFVSLAFSCGTGREDVGGFPNGLRAKIAAGAKFGRCEHLDD